MIMQVFSSSNTRLRISVKDELKEQALGERRKRESYNERGKTKHKMRRVTTRRSPDKMM